jgi:hypothetical protein
MAELGNLFGSGDEEVTSKISVEMLDYEYVKTCTNPNELKGIVSVLKSGKEGFYPQLLDLAEKRLLSILPEKERNKLLRLKTIPSPQEITEAEQDLQNWQNNILKTDKDLKNDQNKQLKSRKLPNIRGYNDENSIKINSSSNENKNDDVSTNKVVKDKNSKPAEVPKRLSGYDFRAWEKFDVEEAISKIEEEEENSNEKKSAIPDKLQNYQELRDQQALKRLESHNIEMENLRKVLQTDSLSNTEKIMRSGVFYLLFFD